MRYFFYILMQPILMWFPSLNVKYTIWLFSYNNEQAVRIMWAIAAHETANFSSILFVKHHNCFGMGYYKGQDHSKPIKNGADGEPENSASYSSIYYSIKDFIHYAKNTFPDVGKALFAKSSFSSSDGTDFSKLTAVVYLMGSHGYFTADPDKYNISVQSFASNYTSVYRIVIALLVLYLPALIAFPYWLYIRVLRNKKYK